MNWIERELKARREERAERERRKREEEEKNERIGLAIGGVFLMVSLGMYFLVVLENHSPDLVVPVMFGLVALIVVVAIAAVALVLNHKARLKEAEARIREAEAMERIMDKPLESFGDAGTDLEGLEAKYPQGSLQASEARHCPKCGAELVSDDQRFCAQCGTKLGRKTRSVRRLSGALKRRRAD